MQLDIPATELRRPILDRAPGSLADDNAEVAGLALAEYEHASCT